MATESSRLVQVGTVGATAVMADVTAVGHDVAVTVTLSQAYTLAIPPGFPARPGMTGASARDAQHHFPKTLAAGTRFTTFACEANALRAAGYAS